MDANMDACENTIGPAIHGVTTGARDPWSNCWAYNTATAPKGKCRPLSWWYTNSLHIFSELVAKVQERCLSSPTGTTGVLPGNLTKQVMHFKPRETLMDYVARYSGSDKARAMHKYTDLYEMIFDPTRLSVRNITEIGVFKGGSLLMWLQYFPNARIFGLDTKVYTQEMKAKLSPEKMKRLEMHSCCLKSEEFTKIGFAPESMDVVIEDASHQMKLSEQLFAKFWPLVRPGGYYIIEDVDPHRGGDRLTQDHSSLSTPLREALEQNNAVMVDTTVGITEEKWARWQAKMAPATNRSGHGIPWVESRAEHNSYLLVVKKRPVKHLPGAEIVGPWAEAWG